LMQTSVACSDSLSFGIQEISNEGRYDLPVKMRVQASALINGSFDQIYFKDLDGRVMPHWIENQEENYADIWVKVPELIAFEQTHYYLHYGDCEGVTFAKADVVANDTRIRELDEDPYKPFVFGEGISNLQIRQESEIARATNTQSRMMDCNCTATQGGQSFSISSIQNAEDDVSFYQYGTPNAASAA